MSLSYCSCLLVWGSVGQIIPEQNYSQASRLFFAFSVSGWRVQQRKCEVTKKTNKKGKKENNREDRGKGVSQHVLKKHPQCDQAKFSLLTQRGSQTTSEILNTDTWSQTCVKNTILNIFLPLHRVLCYRMKLIFMVAKTFLTQFYVERKDLQTIHSFTIPTANLAALLSQPFNTET